MNNNNDIKELIARYTKVLAASNKPNSAWVKNLNSLRLADAAFAKDDLIASNPNHPLQILVLGPTQAGKSTLTNVILDAQPAGISALAGFTVHAQGFASNCNDEELQAIADAYSPMQRVSAQDINSTNLDSFVLEPIKTGKRTLVDKGVVWDSPDFDSIEALGYRHAVLQTAAMADIIILAVSKDKYADKSVWDMLALLTPLAKPMLVCINKLEPSDEQTVVASFEQRYTEQLGSQPPSIVAIPFIKNASDKTVQSKIPKTCLQSLKGFIDQISTDFDRASLSGGTQQLVNKHWQSWIHPIEQEKTAREEWHAAINTALDNAANLYQKSYLDDPSKNDTFNRAIAELLTLLEIPGLATSLAKTRELVTWPARKLLGFGRDKFNINKEYKPLDQEKSVLDQAHQQMHNDLLGFALQQQQEQTDSSVFWSSISTALRDGKANSEEEFQTGIANYQETFAPRIEEAAQRLYNQLEQQPKLLNSLRATRVTAEAASVALAVKSGGLAPADLVIAPAMLSITTMLTESALSKYMNNVKKELRVEQQKLVKAQLLEGIVASRLHSISSTIDDDRLWGTIEYSAPNDANV